MRLYFKRLALSGPAWLLFATIGVGQLYISVRATGEVPPMAYLPFILAPDYAYWWLMTPLIIHLTHRFRFDSGKRTPAVTAHVIAALVFSLFPELIRMGTLAVFRPRPTPMSFWHRYRIQLGSRYGFEVTTYVAICAVVATIDLIQRSRDREMHAAHLETELAQSRLRALSAQLHPHFLFNALNSVAMLIRDGAHAGALRTVVAYGELLRGVMDTTTAEIPLHREMAFVQRYLEIEQTRFPDLLSVTFDVSPDVENALVPSLVLQPIVENALHHAFSGLEPAARLSVSANRQNGTLRLEVTDNGAGLPEGWSLASSSGVGLRNTASRLAECYGSAQRLELELAPNGGTRVLLELPYHVGSTQTRVS